MIAMAGMLKSAQAPASSSGTEAPSRKLKAERAWSSTYIARVSSPRRHGAKGEKRGGPHCVVSGLTQAISVSLLFLRHALYIYRTMGRRQWEGRLTSIREMRGTLR